MKSAINFGMYLFACRQGGGKSLFIYLLILFLRVFIPPIPTMIAC